MWQYELFDDVIQVACLLTISIFLRRKKSIFWQLNYYLGAIFEHQTSKPSLTIELLKLGNFRHKAGLKVGFAYVFFSK